MGRRGGGSGRLSAGCHELRSADDAHGAQDGLRGRPGGLPGSAVQDRRPRRRPFHHRYDTDDDDDDDDIKERWVAGA